MVKGLPYNPLDAGLTKDRIHIRRLYRKYNLTPPATTSMDSNDEDDETSDDLMGIQRRNLLQQMFGFDDEQKQKIEIEPPFFWYVYTWTLSLFFPTHEGRKKQCSLKD